MKQCWPSMVTLAIAVVAATTVVFWGGQDELGHFRVELISPEPGMLLFFPGPYLLLAVSSLIVWGYRKLSISLLLATALLTALHILVMWSDHTAYLNATPGEEPLPLGGFFATIFAWLVSFVILLAMGIGRFVSRKKKTEHEPSPVA